MRIPVILSWSGGKDCALALHELQRDPAYEVVELLTTIAHQFRRISHHGVRETLLDEQAQAIGLPLKKISLPTSDSGPCTNAIYEQIMGDAMADCRARGIFTVGFGDLFLEDLRAWRENNLAKVNMRGVFPLWNRNTTTLAREIIAMGFRAYLSCVEGKVGPGFVGRPYDQTLLADLPPGVDPCGENGEFHSFVYDGPIFHHPVAVRVGEVVRRDGRYYADLLPENVDSLVECDAASIPPVELQTMRIVSLLAGATEIVCALGAGEFLVGRSHECDHPEWVRRLPACTKPAFDINLSSGQIDAEVRRRLSAGEPLYHVDSELIRSLKPELLIAQAHCAVCAVTPGDVQRAGCVPVDRIVTLGAGSLNGIYDDIRQIAGALQRALAGEALVLNMMERIVNVASAVRDRTPPTVVMLEWTDPLFAMGNWGPELVEAANGRPLLGEKGSYSRPIDWQQVRDADPDYLIVAPCGFDLPRAVRELRTLERLPGWSDLGAVRSGRVAFADGNRYFNRSGVSVVETVEIIAEILHGRRTSSQSCMDPENLRWRPG